MVTILGQDKNKTILRKAIEDNLPVLLIGETGVGKTTLVSELAGESKTDLIRVNLTGQTSTDEFVGKWLIKDKATYWQDGILIQAMKKGSWIVLDEINSALPEILFKLHALLDDDRKILIEEKDGEVVRPHKDFRFFATMNPMEEYAGTKELNKAFLSRFPVVLEFKYPEALIEVKILTERTGLDENSAKLMVGVAQDLRQKKSEEKLYYTCSTRDLISWAFLHKTGLSMEDSFNVSILNKALGDKEEIARTYSTYIYPIDVMAKKVKVNTALELINALNKKFLDLEKEKESIKKQIKELDDRKDALVKEIIKSTVSKKLIADSEKNSRAKVKEDTKVEEVEAVLVEEGGNS